MHSTGTNAVAVKCLVDKLSIVRRLGHLLAGRPHSLGRTPKRVGRSQMPVRKRCHKVLDVGSCLFRHGAAGEYNCEAILGSQPETFVAQPPQCRSVTDEVVFFGFSLNKAC